MREYATDGRHPALIAEAKEAAAASKRLGVRAVQRGAHGSWQPACLTPTELRRRRLYKLMDELGLAPKSSLRGQPRPNATGRTSS
jgi:hypothetical protein